jgi:hypothetical protein
MDLGLFFEVVWRYRAVVLPGLLVAIVAAFLATAKLETRGGVHVEYRKSQTYVSYATLFVTRPGFPWGRLNASGDEQARFTSLAIVYANLVTSDPVLSRVRHAGPVDGTIEAAPVILPTSNEALPLIKIAAITNSPGQAIELAQRASNALRDWIAQQQRLTGTPAKQRVMVQEVTRPDEATVFAARSKTLAIVVFLALVMATIAAAFILENLRLSRGKDAPSEHVEFSAAGQTA